MNYKSKIYSVGTGKEVSEDLQFQNDSTNFIRKTFDCSSGIPVEKIENKFVVLDANDKKAREIMLLGIDKNNNIIDAFTGKKVKLKGIKIKL